MQTTVDYKLALRQIIKRKAVGPKGSRHLNEDDLQIIIPALQSDEISLASKAVLIASIIILDRNILEKRMIEQLRTGELYLPGALYGLFFEESKSDFHTILQKILSGKDLNDEEASYAMEGLWSDNITDYEKGVFLIGERLKRESFEENRAFLRAMKAKVETCRLDLPLLIDLADPYDGFLRFPVYTPFTAALLAAIGYPAYCHGALDMAPKHGQTTHKILLLAGKDPLRAPDAVAGDLQTIGWGYIDLSKYFPALYKLKQLRENIVKRPFLATLEKLIQPIQSWRASFLITGFVHSHYKKELTMLLREQKSLHKALLVKGIEGSTQIDYRKKSELITVWSGRNFTAKATAEPVSDPADEWKQYHSLAAYCLETGLDALNGKRNMAREILLGQAVRISRGLRITASSDIRQKAEKALDSGRALAHWQNGCN